MSNKDPSHSDISRRKLLEVATKLFAEQGFEGTSVREIAEAADLNVSLISYYFNGKEGLYRQIIQDHADQKRQEVMDLLALSDGAQLTKESFIASIKKLINHIVNTNIEEPHLKSILDDEMNRSMPHSKDLFETSFHRIGLALRDYISLAQNKGIVRNDINPLAYLISFAFLSDKFFQLSKCSTALQKDSFNLPEDKEQLKDHIFKVLLEGGLAK